MQVDRRVAAEVSVAKRRGCLTLLCLRCVRLTRFPALTLHRTSYHLTPARTRPTRHLDTRCLVAFAAAARRKRRRRRPMRRGRTRTRCRKRTRPVIRLCRLRQRARPAPSSAAHCTPVSPARRSVRPSRLSLRMRPQCLCLVRLGELLLCERAVRGRSSGGGGQADLRRDEREVGRGG